MEVQKSENNSAIEYWWVEVQNTESDMRGGGRHAQRRDRSLSSTLQLGQVNRARQGRQEGNITVHIFTL